MDDLLRRELELLRDVGFSELDLNARGNVAEVEAEPTEMAPGRASAPGDPLAALRVDALGCERCTLSGTRRNVVFGTGNREADLMFVGEAPGKDEDEQGEPFVGRAGKLLTDIIGAMSLDRSQVYIANVIKCRPPSNRNPEQEEIDSCRPFLQRQIELIEPKVIVTLGKFAFQTLLKTDEQISRARGNWHELNGIKVMPTYHPAFLLRTPSAKKEVWEDMKQVMAVLGLSAKPKKG